MNNFISFILTAHAQAQATISISPNIPGIYNVSTQGPCGWIVNFYTFALIIAGILAFGAIVYGGVKYATSAGNASKQSEGRSWIWSALIGLLLLGGAYLILYTINPNLTKCSLPVLSSVAINNGTGGSNPFGNGGSSGGAGASDNFGGGSLTQQEAQSELNAVGIYTSSSGNCSDPNNSSCTSLEGMQR
jgi:hypothetical protein